MKRGAIKSTTRLLAAAVLAVAAGVLFWLIPQQRPHEAEPSISVQGYSLSDMDRSRVARVRSSFSPKNKDDAVSRGTFELQRVLDPETGRIPAGMRSRELAHAAALPKASEILGKNALFSESWTARGPVNVGGRTRALAIDLGYDGSANQRILAGGVSGGMYLSEDNGQTWRLTTALTDLASVTSLAQDPNDRSVWYHGTGELMGASAGGGGAYARGHGIFKSTDGGNTWQKLPGSVVNNHPNFFDGNFDHVWDVVVHPQTSAVFAATFAGIYRSQDGGASWQFVLGRTDLPASIATDLTIAADGSIYAAMSRNGGGFAEYGVFRSTDGGTNWTNVNPPALAQDPWRMVVDAAPSDPNTVYVFVQATQMGAKAQEHQFFRYNAAANTWTDLSANLIDFPDNFGGGTGVLNTQAGYDMLVKVKPDDPNAVWIGGTNLMRSTDGGQSWDWVGGYHPQQFIYPNHHPDQHSMAFYPNDPNAAITGHDGGLTVTNNVLMQDQTWTSISMGYVTSQFYAVAIDPQPNASNLLIGGLQDNGTWVTTSDDGAQPWQEVVGGDGGFAAMAPGGLPHYVSTQLGNIMRASPSGNQLTLSTVAPAGAKNFLFIAPFALDPNDARVMYLAADNTVWRNSNLDDIPATNAQPTSTNWTQLTNSAVGTSGTDQVTTLAVSKAPANRLYFGATDYQTRAKIVRVDNPAANPAGTDITPPGLTSWGYPSSIAIHPNNADEIIATFSNYNIQSVWHSTDGGASWTNVEGNLGGADGPSVRWASIVPAAGGAPVYFLATSTGVYSTRSLSAGTTWIQEGSDTIGNVVVDMIVARPEDGLVVAATHGRGVYSAQLGQGGGGGAAVAAVDVQRLNIEVRPGETGEASFTLQNTGGASLSYSVAASEAGTPGGAALVTNLVFEDAPRPSLYEPGIDRLRSVHRAGVTLAPGGRVVADQPGDVLVLDDGDETPDDFIGFGDGTFVSVSNRFDLTTDFQLEGVRFFMRTEQYFSNPVSIAVADEKDVVVAQGPAVSLPLSPTGRWYDVSLATPMAFKAGKSFYLEVVIFGQFAYPAGVDVDAQTTGKSFFRDPFSGLRTNLNTIQGFENGALLIRALGTQGGGGGSNQPPQAFAKVSTNQPQVGETVTFDASQSSDPDGQVVGYLWDFGDGTTSSQAVATHAYATQGTYTLSLTVTDDGGAQGQVTGQINVAGGGGGDNQAPTAVATVSNMQPQVGETVTFDASQSSDPDGQIAAYAWIFSDGGASNQAVATHAFAQSGTYTYALQVMDNEGAIDQATGTITVSGGGGGGNQLPNAVATVSNAQPQVGESVTFDASQSSDPDGQITAYAWNFGDGGVSSQAVATHAFVQPGTYTYVLQVTDNQGAADQATGSVTVSGGGQSRFVVSPATGALAPGGTQLVTVSFDAQDLPEGTYAGNIVISGNGGAITLPVDVLVSTTVNIEDDGTALPLLLQLEPNYPNPFVASTTIRYVLEAAGDVSLDVYDISGRHVRALEAGPRPPGSHAVTWDGRDVAGRRLASGTYLYRLQVNGKAAETRAMILF